MKNIMITNMVIVLTGILITPDTFCQTVKSFVKPKIDISETINQNEEAKFPSNKDRPGLKDINIDIVRAFVKMFENAKNVTWYKAAKGGCVAKFTNDSVQTMVGYKEDGSWNYILKTYAENKMPGDLRILVKSTFFDYAIMEVTEIALPMEDNIIYRVMIKNDDSFKILRIYNGDMQIAGEYTKP